MKTVFVIFFFAALGSKAFSTPIESKLEINEDVYTGYHKYTINNKDYLKQYKVVLTLFKHVQQQTYNKEHVDIANEYSIQSNLERYNNTPAVKDFLQYYKNGMLPRDEIFSIFYNHHLKQAIALFNILYYAKDFKTFFKTACWARYHLNQGMFLYAFSVALIHRHDTYSMVLPPIYELYPYYFFNNEVIQKAQHYKQLWINNSEKNVYIVQANYSGWYLNLHPEQPLSYFTEDIGINSYYYYYNLYRPFWLNHDNIEIHSYYRGEEFYYFYQQFLARFYLERLSNNFGEICTYDYNDAFKTGYYSSLQYPNGISFPERFNLVHFITNYYSKQSYSPKENYPYSYYTIIDYERRIRDAIDSGNVVLTNGEKTNLLEPHGFNILGNIIEGNPYSPNSRFYGNLLIFARHLLSDSHQPLHQHKTVPSALEHFETSIRDPAFWQLFKRTISYLQKYKHYLPYYSYNELAFPGVKIESVVVDRLITYFDYYNVDLSSAVVLNRDEWEHDSFEVYGRQKRLNHKPFTFKITVMSNNPMKAVVRVFIGPKYDEYGRDIPIEENRFNFVEFDRFKYNLQSGQNVIKRNSQQNYYSTDRTSYKQLYQRIMHGIDGTLQFSVHGSEVYYAFPNRFLLPKGTKGGQMFQIYVIVSPYTAPALLEKTQKEQQLYMDIYKNLHEGQVYDYFTYPMVGLGVQNLDSYALGYPFDRPVDQHSFNVPNSYFKDVIVYHKELGEVNKSTYSKDTVVE